MHLLSLCGNSGPLSVFLIIKVFFNIICIIVPFIIMYRFFTVMFKSVISGDNLTAGLMGVTKNIIAGLIIFLLPSTINFVFVELLDMSDVEVVACFDSATLENVNKLREEEKVLLQQELDNENSLKADELSKQKEQEKIKREEIKKANEEYKKKKEEEEAKKNAEQNSNNSSGSSNTNLKTASKNIFVGDSRTVGLCSAVTGDYSKCSYSSSGANMSGDDIFIAQGSMSYSWFNSTAVAAVNAVLANNPNVTFNIYSLMGVNMLLYDIDKYIPLYNSLATGSWKNHNLILVSVNPVDEAKEAQYGYSTKNNDIVSFNSKLKSGVTGSNVKYCDTYSSLLNSFSTTDGLHYTSSTYLSIYNKIKACGS